MTEQVKTDGAVSGGFKRSRFTFGVEKYATAKGNVGHALVLKKDGQWLAGFGEEKAGDMATFLSEMGPAKVAEAFRVGAIKLAELRQTRAGKTQSTTVESLL